MKRKTAVLFSLPGWFALVTQYVLMIENRVASIPETTIRFFSFFTILTNLLVATYFTLLFFDRNKKIKFIYRPGTLSAITIYITMVGLVYQIVLRHTWQPEGLQMIVDELLHTIIPFLVIISWYVFETTKPIKYRQIATWAVYPLTYVIFILIRGHFSRFYPYPFVDVTSLGLEKVLINSIILLVVFLVVSALFIFIAKSIIKR